MKLSLRGMLRVESFDEQPDARAAESIYRLPIPMAVLILSSSAGCLVAICLIAFDRQAAIRAVAAQLRWR